ncbi:hypothetical protein BC937DRAFT_92865 [Endogone sp. FLAS-F59071]|nr:hypothetical protein BC937DRAFT_92865 [Endogone sp. FLAS-F59071]|eukprot:RUS15129.1 hypothetical protein BC937DRAFT_92865 [Endogone sp. FLAS-F59071]
MPFQPIVPAHSLAPTVSTSNTILSSTPMRIFVVQSAHGLSPSSGGYKANLYLATSLARRGHRVRMLVFCWRRELPSVPNITEEWVQWKSGTKEEGGMEGRVYRFEWEREPRLEVVAIELEDYWKVYPNEGMHESNKEDWVERLKEWLEVTLEPSFPPDYWYNYRVPLYC